MKLKLTLLLLTTISALHAGALKLADITTPTKKACTDIACVLSSHSGKLALATGVAGVLMYRHADIELKRIKAHNREINNLRVAVLERGDDSNALYFSKSLQDAISSYYGACTRLHDKERQLGIGSAQARAEFAHNHNKTLPKNFSKTILQQAEQDEKQAEQELKEKKADLELQQLDQEVTLLRQKLDHSFEQELRNQNLPELQAYYTRLLYCGVCIFLASAISYSMYKAYPKLQKWYSAYGKPTIANAA